ncbi:unnamed protein product [Soboliphyme baturini]|uniref:Na_H_Exchanger domain-containing protein n=1 Tax=Soboliphyme baturini TaxID=241478 RepID=A0A183J569_9BILA|nr:unnamed protein product [Soboliphyme baturini]
MHRKFSNDHCPEKPGPNSSSGLSFGRCFSAGTFIGTCFLSLMPAVRHQLSNEEISPAAMRTTAAKGPLLFHQDPSTASITVTTTAMTTTIWKRGPWPEALILSGFFLAMLVVKSACAFESWRCHRSKSKRSLTSKRKTRTSSSEARPLISTEASEGGKHRLHEDFLSDDSSVYHGCDACNAKGSNETTSLEMSVSLILLLLCLETQALVDGVAVGIQESVDTLKHLFVGVMCREVLCALAFGLRLADYHLKPFSGFLFTVLFGLSVPLGMVIGFISQKDPSIDAFFVVFLMILKGFAAGTLMYIALLEILSSEIQLRKYRCGKIIITLASCFLFFGVLLLSTK